MCQFVGITPFGTDAFLRNRLRAALAKIKQDDMDIQVITVVSTTIICRFDLGFSAVVVSHALQCRMLRVVLWLLFAGRRRCLSERGLA